MRTKNKQDSYSNEILIRCVHKKKLKRKKKSMKLIYERKKKYICRKKEREKRSKIKFSYLIFAVCIIVFNKYNENNVVWKIKE